jgi:hypothetical protein
MRRPEADEYAEFYAGYVHSVPDGDILELLSSEHERSAGLLRGLSVEQVSYRYAAGKWSVKEVVGHIIDAERTFGYRAQCFARRDPARLPGFDQVDYVVSSNADRRSMSDLVDELGAVRQSHVALFRSFDDAMWSYRGIASDCEFTVRALAHIIVGHEIHHRSVIEKRYLNAT